jgi:hypothetical protein
MLRTLSSVRFVFWCAACTPLFFAQRRTHTFACGGGGGGAASLLHSSPGCAVRVHMASDPDVCQSSRFDSSAKKILPPVCMCQGQLVARGDTCTQPTSPRLTCSRAFEPSSTAKVYTHVRPYIPVQSLLPSFHGKADGVLSEHQRDA